MVRAIVYTSNTGFTKKYAEILSRKIGIEAYDLEDAKTKLSTNDEVVYMGWLSAGKIIKLKEALKLYQVKCVCLVGMANPSEKMVSDAHKRNKAPNVKFFYLQGGFDIKKLTGINKFLMQIMAKGVSKSLEKKENLSDDEKKTLDMMKNGGDYVKEENLDPVIQYLIEKELIAG